MGEALQYTPPEEISNPQYEGDKNREEQGPDLSDPKIYLSEFERSTNFSQHVENRLTDFKTQHPGENLTQSDIEQFTDTLRTNEDYKSKLWGWQKEHPIAMVPEKLTPEISKSIHNYWNLIEEMEKRHRRDTLSPDELQNYNIERSALHTNAAKSLVDAGLAPNTTVGRLLVHFMSIEKGYDRPDPQRDERRLNFFR